MGSTPKYLLPYPELTDPADANDALHDLATATETALNGEATSLDGRLDTLEAQFGSFAVAEPGDLCFSMRTSKAGWLLCNGASYARGAYPALADALGVPVGAPNFNVPNFLRRTFVGYDASDADFNAIGKTGGAKTKALALVELPPHHHTFTLFDGPTPSTALPSGTAGGGGNGYSTSDVGGGQAFSLMNPYVCGNVFIKT